MAIIWGLSYLGVQNAINNGWGPFSILFVRTFTAAIILVWFTIKKSYKNKKLFLYGALCGLFGFLGLIIQTYGQMQTTISATSFITSLYIIFVPLFVTIIHKKRESTIVYACCIISVIGCLLLNLEWPLSFNKDNLLGNILVLISAVFFAIQIMMIGKATKEFDVMQLTVVELFSMAFMSLLMMSIVNDFTIESNGLLGVILVGILSSGLCSYLQMFGQKELPESVSGIIMGLESVFGALSAIIVYHETMSLLEAIGCVLIFIPIILIHLQFKQNKKINLTKENKKEDDKKISP